MSLRWCYVCLVGGQLQLSKLSCTCMDGSHAGEAALPAWPMLPYPLPADSTWRQPFSTFHSQSSLGGHFMMRVRKVHPGCLRMILLSVCRVLSGRHLLSSSADTSSGISPSSSSSPRPYPRHRRPPHPSSSSSACCQSMPAAADALLHPLFLSPS
jgi:hypothetical protein